MICSCSGRDVFARYHGRNTFHTRYDVEDERLRSGTPSVPSGSTPEVGRQRQRLAAASKRHPVGAGPAYRTVRLRNC
ncbi:hypothetical protein PT2222_420016 [Paraburkholderia tropica]